MKRSAVISNVLHFPGILLTLIRNVRKQREFIASELQAQLETAIGNNDGTLDNDDIRKITDYYGLAVPAILGEALCVLRGKNMSLRERRALTYQGAMTGLFDDFFDKEKISDEEVRTFMELPGNAIPNNSRQQLFLKFYMKALDYSHSPQLTLTYLQKVYQAQVESKKQAAPGKLSREEIKQITIQKGGLSVLFYRSVLENSISPEEETALYKMGGLMQFGNDIFDIYKDCLQHIDTLITTSGKVDNARSEFRQMMEESFASVRLIPYPPKNVRKFLQLFSMCLCARCFVSLDQLERKERSTGNVFKPCQYSRQDLVCDMDKPINKWRTIMNFFPCPS